MNVRDINKDDLDNLIMICRSEGLSVLDADIIWSCAFIRLDDRSITLEVLKNLEEYAKTVGFYLYSVISNKIKIDQLDLQFSLIKDK